MMSLIFCNLFRERCHTSCFQDDQPWTWKDDMANNFSSLHLVLVAQILEKSGVVLIIFIRKVCCNIKWFQVHHPDMMSSPLPTWFLPTSHICLHHAQNQLDITKYQYLLLLILIYFSHTECTTVKINCLSNQRLET